jgi:hypothetical protein
VTAHACFAPPTRSAGREPRRRRRRRRQAGRSWQQPSQHGGGGDSAAWRPSAVEIVPRLSPPRATIDDRWWCGAGPWRARRTCGPQGPSAEPHEIIWSSLVSGQPRQWARDSRLETNGRGQRCVCAACAGCQRRPWTHCCRAKATLFCAFSAALARASDRASGDASWLCCSASVARWPCAPPAHQNENHPQNNARATPVVTLADVVSLLGKRRSVSQSVSQSVSETVGRPASRLASFLCRAHAPPAGRHAPGRHCSCGGCAGGGAAAAAPP